MYVLPWYRLLPVPTRFPTPRRAFLAWFAATRTSLSPPPPGGRPQGPTAPGDEGVIDQLIEAVRRLSRAAKMVESGEHTRFFYDEKARLLRWVIEEFGETPQVRVSYQRGQHHWLLLVTMIGVRSTYSAHLPMQNLRGKSHAIVISQIGFPPAG